MKRILPTTLKALAAGALAAISINTFAAGQSLTMHSAATGNNYVAYYLAKTPANAQAYCLGKSGHLAVINNHSEAIELQKLADLGEPGSATPPAFWLGSSVAAGVSTHATVTGQTYYLDANYPVYGDESPNNAAALYESFVTTGNPASDYFQWSASSAQYFICEFEDAPI